MLRGQFQPLRGCSSEHGLRNVHLRLADRSGDVIAYTAQILADLQREFLLLLALNLRQSRGAWKQFVRPACRDAD
jgi:hypothetical protein